MGALPVLDKSVRHHPCSPAHGVTEETRIRRDGHQHVPGQRRSGRKNKKGRRSDPRAQQSVRSSRVYYFVLFVA